MEATEVLKAAAELCWYRPARSHLLVEFCHSQESVVDPGPAAAPGLLISALGSSCLKDVRWRGGRGGLGASEVSDKNRHKMSAEFTKIDRN